jgi:hypothetical protein
LIDRRRSPTTSAGSASRSRRCRPGHVAGSHAYVGHIPNQDHLGTSIIDIPNRASRASVATITLDDHESHSH